jgi:hypothetical protein
MNRTNNIDDLRHDCERLQEENDDLRGVIDWFRAMYNGTEIQYWIDEKMAEIDKI